MSDSGFTKGFFFGASLGAMATLLLAPKSGRELRQELSDEGERLRVRASEAATEMRERGARALEKTRETADQTAHGLKDAARTLREGDVHPNERIISVR